MFYYFNVKCILNIDGLHRDDEDEYCVFLFTFYSLNYELLMWLIIALSCCDSVYSWSSQSTWSNMYLYEQYFTFSGILVAVQCDAILQLKYVTNTFEVHEFNVFLFGE